ncbi:MAG: hypothetical protein GY937_15410 [bacterium]|nr:hypothetical protein [bacterium]
MQLHANAKLTPASRRLLIRRVREKGWPVKRAAEAAGASQQTAHKWLRRFDDAWKGISFPGRVSFREVLACLR